MKEKSVKTYHQQHAKLTAIRLLIAIGVLLLWMATGCATTKYGCASVKGTSGYVPYKK